jgi:hypothetical protein
MCPNVSSVSIRSSVENENSGRGVEEEYSKLKTVTQTTECFLVNFFGVGAA